MTTDDDDDVAFDQESYTFVWKYIFEKVLSVQVDRRSKIDNLMRKFGPGLSEVPFCLF